MTNLKKPTILALLTTCLVIPSASGAITGQWNFDNDLSAVIGQPISFADSETEAGTAFNTTTAFGLPNIGGQEARVMRFPKTPAAFGGYFVPTGATANGGGEKVNQYTIIMDVLFPAESQGKRRALIETDASGNSEYAVQANNGIGSGATASDGRLETNTWHRIAFAADLSATPPVLDKFIDGVKVGSERVAGLDSAFGLIDYIYLINDDDGETELGYINSLQIRDEKLSDGLIAALGGPTASGILTGPPPNPYISRVSPSPDTARIPSRSTVPPNPQIQVVIENGTTRVVRNSIVLEVDDVAVTPQITEQGTTTTLTYTPSGLFEALSVHKVEVQFTDDATPPNNLGTQWQFAVGPFSPISGSIALPVNTAGTPGFKAHTVQGPDYIPAVNNPTNLAATVARGVQQLNGTLRDIEGNLVADESTPGPNADRSFDVDVINFTTETEVGNFLGDQFFPGIPGLNGHSTQFATEFLGFLQLAEGTHKLGVTVNASRVDVNDDDNFALYIGQNPRDAFSHVLGSYVRTTAPAFDENSQNANEFTFYAPQAGLYPVRLVYVQSGRAGSLELYSIDTVTGEKILVNDSTNPKAIKSFRNSTSPAAGAPYVAELSPRPGTSGNDPADALQILLQDERTQLDTNTVQLTFNGAAVSPSITKTGGRTTVSYQPNPTRTQTTNDFTLVYADNATPSNRFTNSWSFTSTVNIGSGTVVRGQWDFDQGTLAATVGAPLEYFDGPGGQTQQKTQFGTTASFGIPNIDGEPAAVMKVPGDLSNQIGYIMRHGIAPNGGGTKVNQYTLIYDVLIGTAGPGAASMLQADDANNTSDGDLFWQGNNFGQGQGGYLGTGIFTPGEWHRVAIAVDLAAQPAMITKFVDGVKQDDWRTDGLDGRRGLRDFAILFADGDQDERREWFVNSIQIREGKMSDGELAFLGAPNSDGIPQNVPRINVKGQWDFNGNLSATVGSPLEYFDGAGGQTETKTEYGTASSFGLPALEGGDATVMKVPGDLSNQIGYIMRHGISPNGGGTKVNQYTLIYDVLIGTAGPGAASMLQADDANNTSDGDLFWQGNNFGQGQGGYLGTGIFTPGEWHRVAIAVDLAAQPAMITKFVDGVKQDDWRTDGLDGRRGLRDFAILFADGDQDERREWFVNSVQVREGKLSDAQLTLLGGPTAAGIPLALPETSVVGQWDFDQGNLAATVGAPLEYFDGAEGQTETKTQFGTSTSFGLPDIAGQPALVMRVPGDLSNQIGYTMRHGISPNGGGTRVNQYTLVYDVLLDTAGPGAASMIQIDEANNTSDGDVFWQGNNFGQGQGGYVGTGIFTPGEWHRVALAVDLAAQPAVITKFVDGVKQDDWLTDGLDGRRALREAAILFADGDQDERRVWYVNSLQIHSRKLSDAELEALGTPTADGLPLSLDVEPEPGDQTSLSVARDGANLRISWPATATGLTLESSTSLVNGTWTPVTGVSNNSVVVPLTDTQRFYRLRP